MKFSSGRPVTHEAWPAGYRLANGAGTGAVTAWWRERIAQQIEETFSQTGFLLGRQPHDAIEQSQSAPEGAHPRQEHGKANPQGFYAEEVTGLQSPFYQHRLGDDEGRDFLFGGQRGVAVEEVGMAHFDFQLLEGDFLFPALCIEAEQFERRVFGVFQQTGPEAHDGAVMITAPDDPADFTDPELDFFTVGIPTLDFDEHAPIGKFLNKASGEGGFDADQEVTVVGDKTMEQGHQETAVTVEPIGQQQTMGRDPINEAMGQRDFGVRAGAHSHCQGIMETKFHQKAGPDLGESGPSPSGTGFAELPTHRRRVENRKERAVNAHQQEAFVEGVGMATQRGPGTQDDVEYGFEDLPAQTLATFGNGSAGDFNAGELPAMGTVGSLGLERVEDQQGHEKKCPEFRFTSFARSELAQDAAELTGAEILRKLLEKNTWAMQLPQVFFSLFRGDRVFSVSKLPGCLGFCGFGTHPNLKTKILDFRKSNFDLVFSASCRSSNLTPKKPLKSTSKRNLY